MTPFSLTAPTVIAFSILAGTYLDASEPLFPADTTTLIPFAIASLILDVINVVSSFSGLLKDKLMMLTLESMAYCKADTTEAVVPFPLSSNAFKEITFASLFCERIDSNILDACPLLSEASPSTKEIASNAEPSDPVSIKAITFCPE